MANNKPETLIIITPGFPENEEDTTCIPPQQVFVKALKEVAPQLNIIVLTLQFPFFSRRYFWHGVKVIALGNKTNNRVLNRFADVRAAHLLKKLNKQYKLTGLLSFWFGKSALIGNRFAKKNGIKHYSWILGQDARPGNKFFGKIKPAGGALIALSDFISREVKKNYGVLPVLVIPVGIDIALFGNETIERNIDILGAGSLIPLKRYTIFLDMVYRLKVVSPNIKAVICGAGPEMFILKLKAKALGIQHNVTFAGELPTKRCSHLCNVQKYYSTHPNMKVLARFVWKHYTQEHT